MMSDVIVISQLPSVFLSRCVSHLAFKLRFPQAKWKAARQAAKTDADIADFFENYDRAKFIDLDDAALTRDPVMFLTLDVIPVEFRLTTEEALAVLDNEVQDHERP